MFSVELAIISRNVYVGQPRPGPLRCEYKGAIIANVSFFSFLLLTTKLVNCISFQTREMSLWLLTYSDCRALLMRAEGQQTDCSTNTSFPELLQIFFMPVICT